MNHWSMEHHQQQGGEQPEGPQPVTIENTVDIRGGHPKGTTAAATRLLNKRNMKALNDVTLQFNEFRQSAHGKGVVVKRGELQRVITTMLEESGLKLDAPSFAIAKDTVRYRVKAQTELIKSSTSIATPMAAVEPLLVELHQQKARMGQPLGIIEGLCFAKSLIEGNFHEEELVAWKTPLKLSRSDVSTLRSNYWTNFKRRHDDILDSGSGETQALTRK